MVIYPYAVVRYPFIVPGPHIRWPISSLHKTKAAAFKKARRMALRYNYQPTYVVVTWGRVGRFYGHDDAPTEIVLD